jgi:hypothetical protein
MEKQYFFSVLKCAICKKEGIIHVQQEYSVEKILSTQSSSSGFKYGPIGGLDAWCVACHECFEKSEIMIDRQKLERENFLKGE